MLRAALFIALLTTACGHDALNLTNLLDQKIGVEVRAPDETLSGSCAEPFSSRFCAQEYEVIGVIDLDPDQDQELILADPENGEQCGGVLWLRLVFLEEVGPIDDPGTLIELPADVEVERGAGALHTVAFPQATVRIDEIGTADLHQATPPSSCP